MTRGLRGVWLMRELLHPFRHGFFAVQMLSHKVLRRLAVLPLGAILLATPWLWDAGPVYRAAALGQLAFYGTAALGAVLPAAGAASPAWIRRPARLLTLPAFFCMVNAAAGLAALNAVRGRRIDAWEPQRGTAASPGPEALGGSRP
jgi:hypothetical protein